MRKWFQRTLTCQGIQLCTHSGKSMACDPIKQLYKQGTCLQNTSTELVLYLGKTRDWFKTIEALLSWLQNLARTWLLRNDMNRNIVSWTGHIRNTLGLGSHWARRSKQKWSISLLVIVVHNNVLTHRMCCMTHWEHPGMKLRLCFCLWLCWGREYWACKDVLVNQCQKVWRFGNIFFFQQSGQWDVWIHGLCIFK